MYRFTDLGIWSTVEIGSALAASGLATLKPLFRKLNHLASTARTGGASSGTAGGSYEMHKGRFSVPQVVSGGRSNKGRMSVRLQDEESQFSSPDARLVVSVTAEENTSWYAEPHPQGINKKVTITRHV